MWLMSFVQMVTISAAAAEVSVDRTPSADGLPRLAATRRTTFSIPFRVDRSLNAVGAPREVLLYVSTDQGATWRHCDSARADQSDFVYRAEGEGEYWFQVRMLDASGRLKPDNPSARPLRVAVDTTSPELSLSAFQDPAGSITARWRIEERNPASGSMRLQYRVGSAEAMQDVAIDRNRVQAGDGQQWGEVTWWPRAETGRVEIRVEVADLAGNRAVGHAEVNLGRRRIASNETPWSGGSSQAVFSEGVTSSVRAAEPVAGRVHPAFGNRYPARDSAIAEVGAGLVGPPDPEHLKMVNSRLFEIDYELDVTVSPGLGRVELWGTRDGGRSWSRFGYDNDSKSPMWVSVDREGIHGFRVVLAGDRASATRIGRPDIWIGVDVTEPKVEISSVRPALEDPQGRMVIRWAAEDWMLTEESVSLFYAGAKAGPWTPIVTKIANSAEYVWQVTEGTPQRVYIRLEVRDRAGNVGFDETRNLISLESARPNARISTVRPLVGPRR